jgi:AbrB family looped-hinge helix DNA binding protein
MSIVTASSRGQIVIPRDIRRQLNITPGKKLLMKVVGDQAVLQPLPDDPITAFCGIFKEDDSLTGALLENRREENDRENAKTA